MLSKTDQDELNGADRGIFEFGLCNLEEIPMLLYTQIGRCSGKIVLCTMMKSTIPDRLQLLIWARQCIREVELSTVQYSRCSIGS